MVSKKKDIASEEVSDEKEVVEVDFGKHLDKLRANPWIATTFVLALVLVLVLIFGNIGGAAKISADEAGQNVLDSLVTSYPQLDGAISVVSTEKEDNFYKVTLSYQGSNIPVYTTLDGKYQVNPLVAKDDSTDATDTTDETPTEVPKSDKPIVEVFVMSHCPYGTQIEKGILPVATLLGDKIDFEVKFVYYAMHGEKEVLEQLNQYCIETEQNNKYLDYLQCFLEAGDGESCLASAGVDKAKLNTCTTKANKEFAIMDNFKDQSRWLTNSQGQPTYPRFNTNVAENQEYGVQGSPTLVINGKQASSSRRDPASLLGTICAAFNEAPEECNTELSSASPSAGFGWTTTNADAAAAAQCG